MLSEQLQSSPVYLALSPTDMRKSIDGLALIVQYTYQLDPFSSALFVFCNRKYDKLKILHWQHNGFWLYYRRLEKGKFKWPKAEVGAHAISMREFRWLLDGLDLKQTKAHPPVHVQQIG
jgi:transposase